MSIKTITEHFDLISPDGKIIKIEKVSPILSRAVVEITEIASDFIGFSLDKEDLFFNSKSTLAQLGINGVLISCELDKKKRCAHLAIDLIAYGPYAQKLLPYLDVGSYVGKLFAADPRRKVRDPDYLIKKLGRVDQAGDPLLFFGGLKNSKDLRLQQIEGRLIAYLPLTGEKGSYGSEIFSFFPILGKALKIKESSTRSLLSYYQQWNMGAVCNLEEDNLLLVRTKPLHIRTVFAGVVNALLPQGYTHMNASILDPATRMSGDVYEFFGKSKTEIKLVPLEFYRLEPRREYSLFIERTRFEKSLTADAVFKLFNATPQSQGSHCSAFLVKGSELLDPSSVCWVCTTPAPHPFPGLHQPENQAILINNYIKQQSEYPLLKAIEKHDITSEGILFSRYLPSPTMKQMLISPKVQPLIKGIYFESPSSSHANYFSHEDRTLLLDCAKFGIPVYWADRSCGKILKFVEKAGKDSGMFVPLDRVETFCKATFFGIYGSNLIAADAEEQLTILLNGLRALIPTPIAVVTGGGPGTMELGNKVAQKLGILSCANIIDLQNSSDFIVNEQQVNTYIDAKMTYRIDRLVERQGEFHLDFPIFLPGGIGTDFEFALEEVRRKIGSIPPHPILLFGPAEYWRKKITENFRCNLDSGTIKGSEWISNCFYCVTDGASGLEVYKRFLAGTLKIGKDAPFYPQGFHDGSSPL